ncbi:hypothetical protein VSS74_22980 [Conexibacter stalactiti]|uniref:Uncharacterized protein n=1 Tax=Conexibacter stalactiti TaxID=1940611 RepID=A0ABU4HXN7_9ACTN|nr:hypothetical protein [Conexibacter stalactiti]MDW5597230.1 hypothetical protein [Conexibacter stalactiti]MEC5037872.1 hypothetical protein [Conexibacter stalactiti]
MSDDGPPSAPRHPRIEQRSLLLRGGTGSGLDLARLQRDVVGAIELPLRQAATEQPLLTQVRRDGLGIVLSGEAWRNQLDPAARGEAFGTLPYAQPAPLELERGPLSAAALADYAETYLDAQLAAGATLATTPAHLFERELGEGREQDLALARATIAAWRERQGWRPPPQRPDDPPRELYAGVAVRAAIDPIPALIERYAALSVDGYWLTVFDGDDSAEQLGAVTALALGLQEASGRPVVVAGAGPAQTALLASGLAAVCTDVHATPPQFPPHDEANTGAGSVTAFALPVFHPAILGELPPGVAFEEARTRLFATDPCRCGEHVAHEPPHGRRATVAHNAWCLAAEARDATGLLPVFDEARLGARRQRADRMRARLGLEPLPAGWGAVATAAATVRSGAIRADGARAAGGGTAPGGGLHAV